LTTWEGNTRLNEESGFGWSHFGVLRRDFPVTNKNCQLNRSMQHPSNLLIRQYISE